MYVSFGLQERKKSVFNVYLYMNAHAVQTDKNYLYNIYVFIPLVKANLEVK